MLQDFYKNDVIPKLVESGGYKNPMQVPKLEKVVVNVTTSDAVQNSKVLDKVSEELALITGQKPKLTRAKKSIAGFKLREGMPLGCAVTLRRERMYEFLMRLIHVALPRSRDFKGLSKKGFDGRGNYNMGLKDQIIFPEINPDKVDKNRGMSITIVTSAKTDEEAENLLRLLGMPLRK